MHLGGCAFGFDNGDFQLQWVPFAGLTLQSRTMKTAFNVLFALFLILGLASTVAANVQLGPTFRYSQATDWGKAGTASLHVQSYTVRVRSAGIHLADLLPAQAEHEVGPVSLRRLPFSASRDLLIWLALLGERIFASRRARDDGLVVDRDQPFDSAISKSICLRGRHFRKVRVAESENAYRVEPSRMRSARARFQPNPRFAALPVQSAVRDARVVLRVTSTRIAGQSGL